MAGSGTAHLRPEEDALLRAENLVVEFPVGRTGLKVHAVSDVSLDVREGETLGLVGESGCGKSTTGRALMQLPRPTSGGVTYGDRVLTELDADDLRRVRPEMQMIFQDPISSLNPRRRVGDIVAEPLRIWVSEQHPPGSPIKFAALLLRIDIIQRFAFLAAVLVFWFLNSVINAMTGIAVSILPSIDQSLRDSVGLLLLYALGFGAASYLLRGPVIERVSIARVGLGIEAGAAVVISVLQVRGGFNPATLSMLFGTALVVVAFVAVLTCEGDFAEMAGVRAEHDAKVRRVLEDVGIDPDSAMNRRPHQFSGGQCQRICIARALVLEPKVIICDEPVSALDVSVQAQILNLLEDMKTRYGLTLVFIAHDLAVVKNVSDRVAVMYLGKLCEVGPPDTLYARPADPYTGALLAAIPVPDPTVALGDRAVLGGELPSPVAPPSGCRFRTRCPRAQELCATTEPKMRSIDLGHYVACHFPLDVDQPS